MKANVGSVDRVLRIVIGLALLSLLFLLDGVLRWVGLLGFVALGTALVGWCPAYTLLGISSCATHDKPAAQH